MNTNDQHDRFVRILEEHEPGKKLGHAWNLICRAAEIGWIQEEDIEEIIDCGLDFGVEEFGLGILPPTNEVRVSLLDDDVVISASSLASALGDLQKKLGK